MTITRSDCRFLTAYQAGSADYQPGVTARGTTVPPADLTPQLDIGSTIVITLNVDLMEAYGIGPSSPLLDTEAHLGIITVEDDEVYFNGQPIGDAEARYLARECLEKSDRE